MQIRKWHVVDIHFNEEEIKEVEKRVKRYKRMGYDIHASDDYGAEGYSRCHQLIKTLHPFKVIESPMSQSGGKSQ